MDEATAQRLIYRGYAQASQRLGNSFTLSRATTSDMTAATVVATNFLASFNSEDMTYSKPNKYGKPTWFALLDGTQTKPGDYLVGSAGTWFIAAQQPLLPILAVQCNRTLTFYRPQTQQQFGAVGTYEGNTVATQTKLANGWGASVLQGTKGERNEVSLPGDVRMPWWIILVPNMPGVTLRSGDLIDDDIARRYVISSAEQTDLGWRITAQQAQT